MHINSFILLTGTIVITLSPMLSSLRSMLELYYICKVSLHLPEVEEASQKDNENDN